jgi:hypothetical protein
VLEVFEVPPLLNGRKTFQHRGHREKQGTNSLTLFEAANWWMIDETQPFWRLRGSGESRKLDAGQEFI